MIHLLVDIFFILVAFIGIFYFARSYKKLEKFREMSLEMKSLMQIISGLSNKMAKSLESLKETHEEVETKLISKLPKAQNMYEDFEMMLSHAEKVIARLEEVSHQAKRVEQTLETTVKDVQRGKSPTSMENKIEDDVTFSAITPDTLNQQENMSHNLLKILKGMR